jgi:hypothetical protein
MEFSERILKPESWFNQSWQMFEAALVLWEHLLERNAIFSERDTHRQVGSLKGALLLLGLSAENALKGTYVYEHVPDLSRDRLNPAHFHEKAHDLNEVASKLELSLEVGQVELLARLTTSIQWSSKYRAPLKKADLRELTMGMPLRSTDFDDVENLIESLQKRAGYNEEFGWTEPVNNAKQGGAP